MRSLWDKQRWDTQGRDTQRKYREERVAETQEDQPAGGQKGNLRRALALNPLAMISIMAIHLTSLQARLDRSIVAMKTGVQFPKKQKAASDLWNRFRPDLYMAQTKPIYQNEQ